LKGFAEGAITTNEVTLHYWRCVNPVQASTGLLSRSKTFQTMILLHGTTENGRCWARVAEKLRQNYDLLVPDIRGHGLSEAPEKGYGIEDRAGDVAGLIESLEIDHPILVGHSLGAETAVGVAAIYPHLVRAIVLEEPPWPGRFFGSTQEERAERAEKWRQELIEQKKKSRKELIALAREQYPDWAEEEMDPWAEARQQVSPNISNIVFAPRRRWSDYLRDVECPLLLITAEPTRGAIVSETTVKEAQVFWKNGRTAHISGAGHWIHREQLDIYVKSVRSFLDKNAR